MPEYVLEHKKEGIFDIFSIGDLSYRIGGVKPLFVTSLRVNIRISNGTQYYYDGFDLYLAKSRTAFSQAANRVLDTEPERIEADMLRILEFLESERDAALAASEYSNKKELNKAERDAGMELLMDPSLFTRIVDDMSALGCVGEDINKQLLYLCAISRKRDKPIHVLLLSQSTSGKNYLVDSIRCLLPEDEVIMLTSLSDQALNYLPDLKHKFLVLGTTGHSPTVEQQIREMLYNKELSRLVVEKDNDTGRMVSRMIKIPAIVSCVMGSSSGKMKTENAKRCFVIHADESREQTKRIHEYQRKRKSSEYLVVHKKEIETIISSHKAAQKLLQNIPVVNDFAIHIDFPALRMRSRGDHERFLDLIDCVCFLRQYQKEEQKDNDISFIHCDLEDYRIAYRIMVEGVLNSTMEDLPKGARLLYEQIAEWVNIEAKAKKIKIAELRFTQRQIRESLGLAHSWVKSMIRLLVDYEYLVIVAGGEARSKTWYSLNSDEGSQQSNLSTIPSPEKLNEYIKQKTGQTGKTGQKPSLKH